VADNVGLRLCASLLAEGRVLGVGLGTSAPEIDEAFRSEYVEELVKGRLDARRDYGLIELSLTKKSEWVLTGATLQLHRLPGSPDLLREFHRDSGYAFQPYTAWRELKECFLSTTPGVALQCVQRGDFLEYRNPGVKVSVLVVDDGTERSEWPGHGEVWSIVLG
jgi:hypothetical protein